jgi:SAM-dependent methyltransferase
VNRELSLPEILTTTYDSSGAAQPAPTFRDPSGELRLTDTHALRRIHPQAVEKTLAFLDSPLRLALERSGDMVSTEIVESGTAVKTDELDPDHALTSGVATSGELWLRHPRIGTISYPWEWTGGQWRAAAELTLRIARQAVDAGWMLKDATPLNIVFDGPKPVLVDVLSLEQRDPKSSVWLAYGQFVRSFLLPLYAEKYLNWSLQQTLFYRDGYEPRMIYDALGLMQRLRPSLLDVVTLATMFEPKSGQEKKTKPGQSSTDPELAAHILRKRIGRLAKQVQSTAPQAEKRTDWSAYVQTASHYQAADVEAKGRFVEEVLQRLRPTRVLDIGANTGTYSLLAVEAGAQVVALDNDSGAIEGLSRNALEKRAPITAFIANIARPTPAVGWMNREQLSLLDRLKGQFDLVLMLAVIHHLILREQVPLGHIAELAAHLTRRWLVLEWVPPSDPMFQEWLRGRDDLYGHLSEDDLKSAFAPFFSANERFALGNGRVLFLFERNAAGEDSSAAGRAR